MKFKKDTDELTNEILKTDDLKAYLDKNESTFIDKAFFEYLIKIINSKDLDNKDIIRDGNLNRVYFYHLLSGARKPSRNKVLQLAFGLKLNLDETKMLLRAAGVNSLYSKIKRDAMIIYAISNEMSIVETDIMLEEENQSLICDN